MDTSLFFAKLLGVYYVVMGFVWVVRGPAMRDGLNEWMRNPGMMMLAGVMTLFISGAIVAAHQVYEVSWRGLITLFGYIGVIKGAALLGWPVQMKRDWSGWTNGPLRWIVGVGCLALGVWFSSIGFGGAS